MVLDFKDRNGNWVLHYGHYKSGLGVKHTKIGQLHADMTKRCTDGSPEQLRHARYQGCSMSETFQNPQTFGDWVVEQVGYGLPKYQLDKDILVRDNKLYSEETCVFVPQALNKFMTKRQACRSSYMGVSWKEKNKAYQSSLTLNGKCVYLGLFDDPLDAHAAYKVAKEGEAKRLASVYAGEVDDRVIEALLKYEVLITD